MEQIKNTENDMAEYKKGKKAGKIFQLEIWLEDIKPRIWRSLAVRPFMKLDRMHMVIQKAMGWTNSHLHQFISSEGIYYSYPYPGYDRYDDGTEDETFVKISDLIAAPGDRLKYQYDFGDCWNHIIELKSIETAKPGAKYPVCLAGERACPPEDCGGPWGYADMLDILAGQDSDQKQEYEEWLGAKFDPEAFNIEKINRRIKR